MTDTTTTRPAGGLRIDAQFFWLAAFYVAIVILFSIVTPKFLSWSNGVNILSNITVLGIVALGQTLAIVSGGFDHEDPRLVHARFAETLGCGAIEYLSRWRMALAKDALMRGAKSLDRIADEIGYESASAFSTAFRKRLGIAPGRFARALAAEAEAD